MLPAWQLPTLDLWALLPGPRGSAKAGAFLGFVAGHCGLGACRRNSCYGVRSPTGDRVPGICIRPASARDPFSQEDDNVSTSQPSPPALRHGAVVRPGGRQHLFHNQPMLAVMANDFPGQPPSP